MKYLLKRLTKWAVFFLFICLCFPLPQFPDDNLNISEVGEWSYNSTYRDVAVSGNYAYCAGDNGLDIVDISTPSSPKLAASFVDSPHHTSYTSVEVVNHHAYIIDVYDLHIIDVSDPTAPSLWGSVKLSGNGMDLCVEGQYAYVCTGGFETIDIIDISGPTLPTVLFTYNCDWTPEDIHVSGGYLYAVTFSKNLQILDVSTPAAASWVSEIDIPHDAVDVFAVNNYAYVVYDDYGLIIYDVSIPRSPVKVGEYRDDEAWYRGLDVEGSIAILLDSFHEGLQILDVSDPSTPMLLNSYGYNDSSFNEAVQIKGNRAYIASSGRGFRIMDISAPESPARLGSFENFGKFNASVRAGNYLYIGKEYGLHIMDVSNPTTPTHAGFAETDFDVYKVAVKGPHAFITVGGSNPRLEVYDVSNPMNPARAAEVAVGRTYGMDFISIIGDYAYLDGDESLKVFDISDPTTPVQVGSLSYSGISNGRNVFVTNGDYAYLLSGSKITSIDISSPATPTVLNTLSLIQGDEIASANDLAIKGNYLYIIGTVDHWTGRISVYDLSNPASPSLVGHHVLNEEKRHITVEGNYAYLWGGHAPTINVFDISNPASPISMGYYTSSFLNYYTETLTTYNRYIYIEEESIPGSLQVLRFHPGETPPKIALDRDSLYFSAVTAGVKSRSQLIRVENEGGGTLHLSVSNDVTWLSNDIVTDGNIRVGLGYVYMESGSYTGTLTVTNTQSQFDVKTVTVYLHVYDPSGTTAPFGEMATPSDNAVVSGSVPFTGWALDDIGVQELNIYLVSGNSSTLIDNAVFVEGARPDIESAYPTYPSAYKAGWGYMMLTNFLPGGGNGTYIIRTAAVDIEGNEVTLDTRTIHVDNANAVKPFGAVDTPDQGDSASGRAFANHGWVLTPPPNTVPTDGSTIHVWVDGQSVGSPVYNQYRLDIERLFPGYTNSSGAGGYFHLDTTQYTNGVHTIHWTAEDNAGNSEGIGSRYFSIQNSQNRTAAGTAAGSLKHRGNVRPFNPGGPVEVDRVTPVWVRKGFVVDGEFRHRYPADNGEILLEIGELERLEMALLPPGEFPAGSGEMVVKPLSPLPIGASLDVERGVFYWIPGPGFLGDFSLAFLVKDAFGNVKQRNILIRIHSKF